MSVSYFLTFIVLGLGAAVLCLRYAMIVTSMVAELIKDDPTFQPKYGYGWKPADRTYNVREYAKRFPGAALTQRLRQTVWAFGVWALLGFAWVACSRPTA